MPIDDALKEMDGEKKKKKQESASTAFDMAEIIISHIDKANEFIDEAEKESGTKEEIKLDKNQILPFTKWIKFTYGCKLDIMPIPRKEMLEILSEQDSDFKELLEVSDMSKYLGDSVVITNFDVYNKISEFTDISKIIDFEQIKSFLGWGTKIIIPGLDYFSLFIKEGETLRRYAQITGKAPKKKYIIEIEENLLLLDAEFKPFDSRSLANFCKKTGINEIQEMVKETTELLEFFRQNYSEDKINMNNECISKVKNELFSRLRKYHPEFVCEKKENDGYQIPDSENEAEPEDEMPEPTEEEEDEPYPKGFPADPKSNPPYEF